MLERIEKSYLLFMHPLFLYFIVPCEESNPYWLDIVGNYTALHKLPLLPTLDCINNPRWKGKNTIYAPENVDRIYILDNWAAMKFVSAGIFGTAISSTSNLSASDHYGVVVDVEFVE